MRVVVPAEELPGERRVAAVPETVAKLVAAGAEVVVAAGAGAQAWYPDDAYTDKGARIAPDIAAELGSADVLVKVTPPTQEQVDALPAGAATISFLPPQQHVALIERLAQRGLTAFSLELVPRISRAQSMDALTSQSLVGGYRAVLAAAQRLPKFLPMFMTAAGTIPPAKVLVLGAGVAGLQAIATARRLGAVVEAYDVRTAAAEEVRSLGAKFLELELDSQEGAGGYARAQSAEFIEQQRALLTESLTSVDAVVTTAAVPGRKAPVLITADMVAQMRPGAVVIDLAAESGGNCELTVAGEDVEVHGVTVFGPRNVASEMPMHASSLLARNIANLLVLMTTDGSFSPDPDDEIVAGCCLTRDGQVVHPIAQEAVAGGEGT